MRSIDVSPSITGQIEKCPEVFHDTILCHPVSKRMLLISQLSRGVPYQLTFGSLCVGLSFRTSLDQFHLSRREFFSLAPV